VQKGRLVEKIAELLNERKLPLVADMRDESAEDIRVVIEPRARTVDANLMMESLFKLSGARSAHSYEYECADRRRGAARAQPQAEALRAWLDHRREVLQRRSPASGSARSRSASKCSPAC
jgi:topoisomerase-4 subunit A